MTPLPFVSATDEIDFINSSFGAGVTRSVVGSVVGSVGLLGLTPSGEVVSVVSGSVTGVPLASVPASEVALTSLFDGSLPVAVATFSTPPASTSACVRLCVAVNVLLSLAPTARLTGPPATVASVSVIVTLVKDTLPLFFTVNV